MREPSERAAELMKPFAGTIEIWQVPADVGAVRNNPPELMQRVDRVALEASAALVRSSSGRTVDQQERS